MSHCSGQVRRKTLTTEVTEDHGENLTLFGFHIDPYGRALLQSEFAAHRFFCGVRCMRFIDRLVLCIVLLGLAGYTAFGQTSAPAAHHDIVIRNAVVMTVTHGNIKNGSIYIKDGKIAAVGENVDAPSSATVIDAGGKYVTPGIVDALAHRARR